MKILFALPGAEYPRQFIIPWTGIVTGCLQRGHKVMVSQEYVCDVRMVRVLCLGGNMIGTKDQLPFDGKLDYDCIMWIDSDTAFEVNDFFKLLETPHEITSGLCLMGDGRRFAACKSRDKKYFKQHGMYEYITPESLKTHSGDRYIPVEFCGMAWMLVKRGVFENKKIEYPWFIHPPTIVDGIIDTHGGDVSFCLKAKNAGYKVMIDSEVIVGHIKPSILFPDME